MIQFLKKVSTNLTIEIFVTGNGVDKKMRDTTSHTNI